MDQALRAAVSASLPTGTPLRKAFPWENPYLHAVCAGILTQKTRRQRWTASTTAGTCSDPARASFPTPGIAQEAMITPPVPGAGPQEKLDQGLRLYDALKDHPPLPVPPPGRPASGRPGGRAPVRGVCRPHPGHLQRHEGGALLPHRGGRQRVCGPFGPLPRPVEELIAETEACYDRLKHRPFGTGQFTPNPQPRAGPGGGERPGEVRPDPGPLRCPEGPRPEVQHRPRAGHPGPADPGPPERWGPLAEEVVEVDHFLSPAEGVWPHGGWERPSVSCMG